MARSDSKLVDIGQRPSRVEGGDNGGRDSTGERLARVEEGIKHLATKAEIVEISRDLSAKIGDFQHSNLKFYVITLCSAIALAIGVVMLYIHLAKPSPL